MQFKLRCRFNVVSCFFVPTSSHWHDPNGWLNHQQTIVLFSMGTNQPTNRAPKKCQDHFTSATAPWVPKLKILVQQNWEKNIPQFYDGFLVQKVKILDFFLVRKTPAESFWRMVAGITMYIYPLLWDVFLRFLSQWLFRSSSIFHQVGSCGSMTCHGHVVSEWLTLQSSTINVVVSRLCNDLVAKSGITIIIYERYVYVVYI